MAEEGSRELLCAIVNQMGLGERGRETGVWGKGEAYAVVETEEGVIAEDVHEGAEHAFGAIGGAGLEADLPMVSA